MEHYALLSVSDKTGLTLFAQALVNDHGYKLMASGNTAAVLKKAGLVVEEVSDYTNFPEMMDGRVKTLHPKIHGGILCKRSDPKHVEQADAHGIRLIDLVIVNLYPFTQTIESHDCTLEKAIENIDIGGPSLLRSAAKNYRDVTVVSDPADYDRILSKLNNPEQLKQLRWELATKVFQQTARYDQAIAKYLSTQGDEPDLASITGFTETYQIELPIAKRLRYGENPHQQAALYGHFFDYFKQLRGKDLSYNNILDITAATYLIGEFEKATIAILKHTNPCGVATADNIELAWENALATDRQSPFGGIIVANRTIDDLLASKIADLFCEVIIAPCFTDKALDIFSKKKNLRLMISTAAMGSETLREARSVLGGVLLQDRDQKRTNPSNWNFVTERKPSAEEMEAMLFGWRVVKHVKSNAIVLAKGEQTLGIGAGQMSRIDSTHIAIDKAKQSGLSLKNAIMASDAFFPFADAIIIAAEAGITAIIQPGGSVRDPEVVQAANENNIAMVFTNNRHFRH